MIIVLSGTDSFRKRERIRILRNAFIKKFNAPNSAVLDLSAVEQSIQEIQLALAGGDLFSTKKFVILRSIFDSSEADQVTLLELLQKISEDVICVIVIDALPTKKSELKTFLESVTNTEQFPALTVFEATEYVEKLCRENDARIDQATARLIAEAFHADTWQLYLQTKALCFRIKDQPKPTITREMALEILPEESQENFFALTDAITARRAEQAAELIHQHLSEGAATQLLATVIFKHLTLLRIFAEQPTAELQGVHAFVQQKAKEGAKRYSVEELEAAMNALITLDVDSKSGKLPDPESRFLLILSQLLNTKKEA